MPNKMKKLLFIFLISAMCFSVGTTAFARTRVVKHVVKKTVKSKVAKVKRKTLVITSAPKNLVAGVVTSVDYDNKTFTMNVGTDQYTVTTTGKTYVSVPGVRRGTSINNIAEEMNVKVAGTIDKNTMTISARTIYIIYTHMK